MIVVTGGAGFIGSILVWKLNALGITDILVVDQFARNTPKWDNIRTLKFSRYLESDAFLTAIQKKALPGPVEAIFHMGACSDTLEMNKAYLHKNNFEYSREVASWCIQNEVYLGYASSAAVYGDGTMGFSDDDAKTPSLKPLNPYGQSKLDFDVWVLQNGYQRLVTGYRFFNVYGPNEGHKGSMRSMIHKGYEQVRDTGKIRLFESYRKDYPDGGQKRDFVYVKDVVDVMVWFYQHSQIKGIYNVGSGLAQTWNDLAAALFKACQKENNIEYIEMPESLRSQYQYLTQADLRKLKKSGQPIQFRNLETAVLDYVDNHLLNKEGHI